MNDREFENYLALLTGMLRLRRTQRECIAGELRDHLIEHVAHLEASGVLHEEAVRRALEEFGDAAALAANFSALVGMRRRRLIMRCTIGTTMVMAGLVVGLLAFRPEVRNDSLVANAQEQTKPGKPAAQKRESRSEPDSVRSLSSADAQTRTKLKQTGDVDFTDVPVSEALAFLKGTSNIQYYIDKRSLTDASIPEDAPVSLHLKNVPLEMVLDLVLRQANLGYRIRNGVVMIASEQDVQSQTEARVYRVPEEAAMELLTLIAETIEPHSWRDDPQVRPGMFRGGGGGGMMGGPGMGGGVVEAGGPGSIRPFRGVLVVSQTPEVHEKIEKLLKDLEPVFSDISKQSTHEAGDPAVSGYGSSRGGNRSSPSGYGASGYGSAGYGRSDSGRAGFGRAVPSERRRENPGTPSNPSSGERGSPPPQDAGAEKTTAEANRSATPAPHSHEHDAAIPGEGATDSRLPGTAATPEPAQKTGGYGGGR
jgi:hypothetical protein